MFRNQCGPDLVCPCFLKEGADILARLFCCTLFSRSLEADYFPTAWNSGNVSLIYKKDDRSLPSNYRPIILLNPVAKVMERCVHKRLYNYVTVNHILTLLQSGFVQGDSTTFQLLHTYHILCEAVDCGKEVRAVLWHQQSLQQGLAQGPAPQTIRDRQGFCWFRGYLSGRKQPVVVLLMNQVSLRVPLSGRYYFL